MIYRRQGECPPFFNIELHVAPVRGAEAYVGRLCWVLQLKTYAWVVSYKNNAWRFQDTHLAFPLVRMVPLYIYQHVPGWAIFRWTNLYVSSVRAAGLMRAKSGKRSFLKNSLPTSSACSRPLGRKGRSKSVEASPAWAWRMMINSSITWKVGNLACDRDAFLFLLLRFRGSSRWRQTSARVRFVGKFRFLSVTQYIQVALTTSSDIFVECFSKKLMAIYFDLLC